MRTHTSFRFSVLFSIILLLFVSGGLAASATPAQAQTTPTPLTFEGDQAAKFQQIHMIDTTDGWAVVGIPDPYVDPYAPPDQVYAGTFAHVLHTHDGGQTWVDVSPPTPYGDAFILHYIPCDCFDNGLLKFAFVDDQHAFIANDMFGTPSNQIYNLISVWVTSDGGESWTLSNLMDAVDVLQMDFLDAEHGWLMVGEQAQTTYYAELPSTLYQTVDGGLSWQMIADDGVNGHYNPSRDPISSPETGIIPARHTGMAFDTLDSGWITWSPIDPPLGYPLHSTDGGATWDAIDLSGDPQLNYPSNGCRLSGMQTFAPGSVAFVAICMNYDSQMHQNWLYRSDDAGATWESHALPNLMLAESDLPSVPQIMMLDADTGWMVQCEPSAEESGCDDPAARSLAQTRDGGATWTTLAPLPADLMLIDITGALRVSFIDADQGWAVTNSGGLMTTTDGGATWSALSPTLAASS